MNLSSVSEVRAILRAAGIRPNKRLGQSFLVDANILGVLVRASCLTAEDRVLEIGPGLGIVTEQLLARCARVVAVEKDRRLFRFLREKFAGESRLQLICADMLDVDARGGAEACGLQDLVEPGGGIRLDGIGKAVSNLPYSSGTRMLVNMIRSDLPVEHIVVTVQKEVAERLTARAGGSQYGLLSIAAQLVYRVEIVKTVSPTCFWPAPAVESAIVRLVRHEREFSGKAERDLVWAAAKEAFGHRRKQLAAALSRVPGCGGMTREAAQRALARLALPARARPEDLTVRDWVRLVETLKDEGMAVR